MKFKITGGKGFHITFENGYTVSVQFGGGSYCDNYCDEISSEGCIESGKHGSLTAEVSVLGKDGKLIAHPDHDGNTVARDYEVSKVLAILNWAAEQEE